jgi:hypothetical protein
VHADDVETVASHAREEGATVAVNANFFGGYPANFTCGLARGFGAMFAEPYAEAVNCVTSIGWARDTGAIFDSSGHERDAAFLANYTDIVTGGGYLLDHGNPRDWNHAKLEDGRGCTAVGLSGDRKRFVMIVTNRTACTGAGLQQALLAHGAADAIHLDGGGSSKMWIRGKGYVNDEPEDRQPPVAVIARPNGACPSDCGAAPCVELAKPFRAECVGLACRAGLDGTWNCDAARRRRVACRNGLVVKEYCAERCEPMPAGVDDACVGGVVDEPAATPGGSGGDPSTGGSDAGAPPASAGARDVDDTPMPPTGDADGCAASGRRGRAPSEALALLLALAGVCGATARRRARLPSVRANDRR